MIKKFITYFLHIMLAFLPLLPLTARAQLLPGEKSVTISFLFRQGKTNVDLTYMDNIGEYVRLQTIILSLDAMHAKSLSFTGSASPEGTYAGNKKLTQARADKVVEMLRYKYPDVFDKGMKTDVTLSNESWSEVTKRLKVSHIEGRDEALKLIESYSDNIENEQNSNALKQHLGALHGGRTWDAMYGEIFPYTRKGTITIVFEPVQGAQGVQRVQEQGIHDTIYIKSETTVNTPTVRDTVIIMKESTKAPQTQLIISPDTLVLQKVKKPRHPWMAVKTNLLFDLGTAANIELEFPIKNRVSILLEHNFPWWIFNLSQKYYTLELLRSGMEVRVWMGNRKKRPLLSGLFAGVYASADYFDGEWNNKGWQSETFMDFGATLGWSAKIHRNWRLELSLGVGYFSTKYTEYNHHTDIGLLIYNKDDKFTWIGPTKLKCSISWLLPNYPRNKKKGGEK